MGMTELSRNFSCIRCGNSCRLVVKVNAVDLKRISNAPHVKKNKLELEDYAEPDDFDPETGNHSLLHKNGGCVFLSADGPPYSCKIYDHRPQICRLYPFIGGKVLPCSALSGKTS